jgi:hypothetical protein
LLLTTWHAEETCRCRNSRLWLAFLVSNPIGIERLRLRTFAAPEEAVSWTV